MDYPRRYLQCRVFGHGPLKEQSWDEVDVKCYVYPFAKVERCLNCRALIVTARDVYDRVIYRRYIYPDDYAFSQEDREALFHTLESEDENHQETDT